MFNITSYKREQIDTVNLTCIVSGHDITQIRWKQNGEELWKDEMEYNISFKMIGGFFRHGQLTANQSILTIGLNSLQATCSHGKCLNVDYTCEAKGLVAGRERTEISDNISVIFGKYFQKLLCITYDIRKPTLLYFYGHHFFGKKCTSSTQNKQFLALSHDLMNII